MKHSGDVCAELQLDDAIDAHIVAIARRTGAPADELREAIAAVVVGAQDERARRRDPAADVEREASDVSGQVRLRAWLASENTTQEELASRCRVSQSTISRLVLSGTTNDYQLRRALERELGIPMTAWDDDD